MASLHFSVVNELQKQWGENIANVRKMRGFETQQAFADALGVEQQSVSRWELGHAAPRDQMKLKIAATLGCEVRMLFPLVAVAS